uniref:ATP synthase F0 subunit 8 n=1 Tax=Calophya californica TaxID=2047826 RepID=A0A343LDQ4_9HEMI|nr:ATP synthase F0 subunit 8 [Calophya californica]ATN42479.1 ATP synthase F0 subunit 8 [Calophya californica]
MSPLPWTLIMIFTMITLGLVSMMIHFYFKNMSDQNYKIKTNLFKIKW